MICFKVIKYLEHFATKNVEQSIGTNAEKSAALLYKQLRDITLNSSPVNLEFFEQLLSKIEKSMEDVYPSLTNRHQIEEDLVVSATVHPDLKNILNEAVSFLPSIFFLRSIFLGCIIIMWTGLELVKTYLMMKFHIMLEMKRLS